MSSKQLFWEESQSIDLLEKVLREDKIILASSDTVFGLFAPLTLAGFNGLNHIKIRENKPYLITLPNRTQVEAYCQIPTGGVIEQLMNECWPGPLTLILPAKPGVGSFLTRGETSIAIRIPNYEPLLRLLDRVGGLFSTSANRAGYPVPKTIDQIDQTILEQVALIVTDSKETSTVPSTILDCTTAQVKLIRAGAYPIEKLEKICGPLKEIQ